MFAGLLFRLNSVVLATVSGVCMYVCVWVCVCMLVLFELESMQTGFALQPKTVFPLYTVPDARR